ncbi:MAG: GNAT family N-acetyltransferase [Rhodothermia bacterium]|mgnify:CR=1 FL=1|nr:GNAT family N-acetyltransferase [Rhodothermia bacterium]
MSLNAIRIEAVQQSQLDSFRALAIGAYLGSYPYLWTPENLQRYLDLEYSQERLLRFFTDPNSAVWWTFLNEKPVGYTVVRKRALIQPEDKTVAFLHRLYLLPEAQGLGIGQGLYQKAAHFAQAAGETEIWLYCMASAPAVLFYRRNGYKTVRTTYYDRIPMRNREISKILVMKKSLIL